MERLFSYLLGVGYFLKFHSRVQHAYPITVGGTGLFACQLAKNVFGAGKVITTVSTAKVSKVKDLLGDGVVDESKETPFATYALRLTHVYCDSHRLQTTGSEVCHSSAIRRFYLRHYR